MTVDRQAVARVLDQIAEHLELQNENPLKIRAFRMGARSIVRVAGEPEQWLADGVLDDVPGSARGFRP